MTFLRLILVSILFFGCGESHEALAPGEHSLFVGGAQSGVVAISRDGIDWEQVPTGASGDIADLAFGEGVVVGVSSDSEAVTSRNGRSWRRVGLRVPDDAGAVEWISVAYAADRFVVVGASWDVGTVAYVSDDGIDWRAIDGPRVRPIQLIVVGDKIVMSAGHLGDLPDNFAYVINGDTFTEGGLGAGRGSESVEVDGQTYVGGAGGVHSTTDGMEWIDHGGPSGRSFSYGEGFFVIAGERNEIQRSSDLETWTQGTTPLTASAWFPDLVFGAGRFVAAGREPIQSDDALSWARANGVGELTSVTYAPFAGEVIPATPERGDECDVDGPLECGDTYCAWCDNGYRETCSTDGLGTPEC